MHFEFVEFFGYLEVISADGYFWLIFVPFVMYLRHHLYLHFSVFIGKNGLTFVVSYVSLTSSKNVNGKFNQSQQN